MDRNTTIGLVLIGLLLTVFSIVNQPSKEEIAKREKAQKAQALKAKKSEEKAKKLKKKTSSNSAVSAETPVSYRSDFKEQIVALENEKLRIEFTNRGGMISAVYLKGFSSYSNFAKNNKKALCLFKAGDAVNQLIIPTKKGKIYTGTLPFETKATSDSKLEMKFESEEGSVTQKYQLNKGKFDLDYKIAISGWKDVSRKNIGFYWKADLLKTERLFSEQRRISTVCYEQKEQGFNYLSETSNDYSNAEDDINWIAFKQSYFSAILKPSKPFLKDGTKIAIENYKEGHKKQWTHLKIYQIRATPQLVNDELSFNLYFGPNDYQVLKSYDSNYDDILNLGWGLFRWINLYAVQPIFDLLINNGIGAGIAILLLTLILKTVLMPVQWKMFVSSVKMRILKPQVDELNAKYPKPEDAIKKQTEMMTLYRESGASPLAGCLPMLIQMPILLAVFRFFPTSFSLRQQSFLWAEDLSSYDSIWDFGFYLWPYGDHVSLFTLLMSITTLVYTFMNSGNMQQPQQPGMPNMKVIMYIFPVMMIFFFNNYSAGLSYYYFISTLISILMMVIIKQFFVDEEKLRLKMEEKKAASAGKEKKKSRFQERLEEMQRKQQEMLKNKKK